MRLVNNQYVRLGISYEGHQGTSRRGLRRICASLYIKLFNYILEASTSALQPWSHFRVHSIRPHRFGATYARHLVWGQFSIEFGQPHLMPITVCADCMEQIGNVPCGDDDMLSFCEGCQAVEGSTTELTMEQYEALHA